VIARLALIAAALAGTARADDAAAVHERQLSPRNDTMFLSMSQIHDDELISRDLRLSAGVPLLRGDGYGLALFQRYAVTEMQSERYLADDLVLHRFDVMVGGGARLAPEWSLRGAIGLTYASDLHIGGVSADAMHGTAAAIVHHVLGPSDAMSVGVAYASSSELLVVLPILGYVHQRAGSPFRFDAELPHHVRAVYAFAPAWEAAFGIEVHGDVWLASGMRENVEVRRSGGAMFLELGLAAYGPIRVEARGGLSVDTYRLPDPTMPDATRDLGLRPASFAQLQVTVLPR